MGNCAVFPKAQPTHEIFVCSLHYSVSKLKAGQRLGMWLSGRALAGHSGGPRLPVQYRRQG